MHTRIYECVYLAVGLACCHFCTLSLLLSVKNVFWDTVQWWRRRATWSKPHTALSVSSGWSGSRVQGKDVNYYSRPEDTTAMIAELTTALRAWENTHGGSCMGWHVYWLFGWAISEINGSAIKQNSVPAPDHYVCLHFLNDTGSFPGTEIIVLRDHIENYWEQLAGIVVGR